MQNAKWVRPMFSLIFKFSRNECQTTTLTKQDHILQAHAQRHNLEFHGGRQFKWIFRLKIVLFEESRSVLPFQFHLTIIFQRKNCEEFRRT